MSDPKPSISAPRPRRPTVLLLMALVALGAGLLGVLKQVEDTRAERRKMDLEVEANLSLAAAEAPRIRAELAAREAAVKAADRRQMERAASAFHAFMARSWDRLAEKAREADGSEIPEILEAAERLRKQDAGMDETLLMWRQRYGPTIPIGPPGPQ